ncbi:MAG: DUF2309 domain-containing protein [Chromatiales bacterium]|nr:DUF2309 domain-containing protein [Chromatiales bacterium]
MSLALGKQLKIRAMAYVAAEPIPYFWPMRAFIHHNPLHSLEHLPFEDAVRRGEHLFHGRGFLTREVYQNYLRQGKIGADQLAEQVSAYLQDRDPISGIDLATWLTTLLTKTKQAVSVPTGFTQVHEIASTLKGVPSAASAEPEPLALAALLSETLLGGRPVYETVDALYGTCIGQELDEMVIRACLDFFDEGQSVWEMPGREAGFFASWSRVADRKVCRLLGEIRAKLEGPDSAEGVIAHVMEELGVPEDQWVGYFTRELSRLHGWAGFIRWRSSAQHYYWTQRYPGDLVDLLAVRLTLGQALLLRQGRGQKPSSALQVKTAIQQRTREIYLRHELYSGAILPAMAHPVEMALQIGNADRIDAVFRDYAGRKRQQQAKEQAKRLNDLAALAGEGTALNKLNEDDLGRLLDVLRDFERHEGMIWLQAMEANAMSSLLSGVSLEEPLPRDKRPFAQAMFCIDTRSERIRRHLEGVGDYQTFGIAGFFGVPLSFMELGKGSENHLCPVLLTPKNLVLEMTAEGPRDEAAVTSLEKAIHNLKESVLTPFVTVEAIGLLFGFDMVGKTIAPQSYNRLRHRLHEHKPRTHLMLDKLSQEQADSIVRAVQRAVIEKAVEKELNLPHERITDAMIRELRETALGHADLSTEMAAELNLDETRKAGFVERLRKGYRINSSFARLQMERLGRIGFSLDEQVHFVGTALRAIGLVKDFSRFVLLAGHGSTSENNPYESALDCGACGGNHGLTSARVLAQMANKSEVRRRLRKQGIDIADDVWFMPALHNTTTDELNLFDLELMPSTHLVYLDRLRGGLASASRLCAQERLPSLQIRPVKNNPAAAYRGAQRNAMDWSQVRPEWGLSRNAYFIIGRRSLTQHLSLDGRAFLHSYDFHLDPKRRLLESILTGPLVVGQWINMEHYFSAVDNERFGSGSKVYHNVAGRFGVMSGNLSDLRTGLPSQTVLENGRPYHEPQRLITLIEAPFEHASRAIDNVVTVKNLVRNGWIRLLVIDPDSGTINLYQNGKWLSQPYTAATAQEPHRQAEIS